MLIDSFDDILHLTKHKALTLKRYRYGLFSFIDLLKVKSCLSAVCRHPHKNTLKILGTVT